MPLYEYSIYSSLTGINYSDVREETEGDAWIQRKIDSGVWGTPSQITYTKVNVTSREESKERMRLAEAKAETYKKFKSFGETVELYFTALINERNYTQAQKDLVQSDADVIAILSELKFGRIGKAKGMVDAKASDDNLFYRDDLDSVSELMGDFLSNL